MVNCEAKLTPVCGQDGNPALLFIFMLSTFVILFIVPYFPRQLGIMDTVYDRAHFLPNLLNTINPGSSFCS